jgi:hypothetical protein
VTFLLLFDFIKLEYEKNNVLRVDFLVAIPLCYAVEEVFGEVGNESRNGVFSARWSGFTFYYRNWTFRLYSVQNQK